MSDSRWTLFDTVLRQRPAGSFIGPAVAATITSLVILAFNFWVIGRVADPVNTIVWIAVWQAVGGWAMATFSTARFAKFRLTPDDWMLLSMTGSGSRLHAGIWGPPHRDAFVTFLMVTPMAAFFAVTFGVSPATLAIIQFNGLLWLTVLLLIEQAWSFLGLRGPLGLLVSRQLRWIVPLVALSFGRVFLGQLGALLPDMTTTPAGWLQFTGVSIGIACLSAIVWLSSGRVLVLLAGERFGHIEGGAKLKDIELPKVFKQKTSRPSHRLRTSRPILEREVRAVLLGPSGQALAVLVGLVIVVSVCDYFDLLRTFRRQYLTLEFWDYLRFALLWIIRATGLGMAAQVVVGRFDAEAREQTIVPLVLATSAQRYLYTTMAVCFTLVVAYFGSTLALNLLSLPLDTNSWEPFWVLCCDAGLFLFAAYLGMLTVTVRLTFNAWPAQLGFLVFGLVLAPIAVFVMPRLIWIACDRIDGDPDHLERGLSKQFRVG